MNKSVLLPIQPYWAFLIIAKTMGWNYTQEKTVEVRKTFPQDEEWDKSVKIYCSKNKKSFSRIPKKYQPLMKELLGKVVGEFQCDKTTTLVHIGTMRNAKLELVIRNSDGSYSQLIEKWISKTCLSMQELENYSNGRNLYAWHISDLKFYDKPKELYEFKTFCNSYYDGKKCDDCKYFIDGDCYEYDESDCGCNGFKPLEKPPQSWCYVKEAI